MKLKTATAIVISSLTLLAASLAVAQQQQQPPPVGPRPMQGLPIAPRVPFVPPTAPAQPQGSRPAPVAPPPPARTDTNTPTASTPAPVAPPPPGAPGASDPGRLPGSAAAQFGDPRTIGVHGFDPGIDYQPLPPGARVTFNLSDAELPDLIRAIGNITGKRFILSGKARSVKATVYSPTRVTPAEAYQAFLSVLQTNGLTVIPSGRFLKIEESAAIATNPVPTSTTGEGIAAGDQYMTRIHRLRNMSAEDAANVLGHFKSRDGDVTAYPATNTVIISDTGANIRRMMQILAEVDVPGVGEQIWVERVNYASATDLAQRITELLNAGSGGGAARPAGAAGGAGAGAGNSDLHLTRITPDERSNSLIIVATERMYLRVLELIRRLDVPVSGEGEVHVYYLQHADSEELANTLNAITTGARAGGAPGAPAAGAAAGARGPTGVFEGAIRITADKRTNALVITSAPRDYAAIRHVITELDRARRQVFIEAVVMELGVNNTTKVGVSWHGGAEPAADTLVLGGFQAQNSVGYPQSLVTNQDALQGAAVGVRGPIISGTQNIIPGLSLGIPSFGAVLTAVAQSGDGDVLATPSIIATDNSPADINVGQNIPLQTNIGGGISSLAGAAGATGVGALGALGGLGLGGGFAAPRQDVGTKIRIVPHINDSNEIRMEIDEEISEAGDPVGALGAIPINKRTAKTTAVVQDQQTVVIGGLIRNAVRRGTTRIPLLGDIPILGVLFRTENRTVERRNLLLFLTPYVIRDQSDLRRIFERKMRERQEFLDRYFVFSESQDYHPLVDYTRTNGMVEEIREAIRDLRVQAEIETRAIPRPPPPHSVSQPIELPVEVRIQGPGGAGGGGAGVSAPAEPAGASPPPAGPAPPAEPVAPASMAPPAQPAPTP